MLKKLVCLGSQCRCTEGVTILPVVGGEKNFLSEKNPVLLEDSTVVGNFGICKILSQRTGNPTPCTIVTDNTWREITQNISINGKKPLLEKSYLKCMLGGKIELMPLKSNIEVIE